MRYRISKKAKEIWVGYYFYVPNTPDNFKDKLLQPYITQFYSVNRKRWSNQRFIASISTSIL